MPKINIAGFCLGGTKNLLYKLRCVSSCYVLFQNNLDYYLKMIKHEKPDAILVLGSYSGRDQGTIRVETHFTNQFRNNYIDSDSKLSISVKPFFKLGEGMKISTAAGNSWCNMFSYKIAKFIENENLNIKYTFLHIPKNMKDWTAQQIIEDTLA